MTARRSALSVPGSSAKMLARAATLAADEVVIDLEDAVAPAAKEDARRLVGDHLAGGGAFAGRVAVRINAPGGPWAEADVAELVARAGARIGTLVVPKVESPADLLAVEGWLAAAGAPGRRIGLQALVETAAGLLHAGQIAAATPRLEALILGYADLSASLGRGPGATGPGDWRFAQEMVLVAARAWGRQAIDGPYLEIRDDAGLRERAALARGLGYDGKWAVHPSQLEPINDAFTPGADELAQACAVLDALAAASGRGAVELDGAMIDEASRKQAEQVVARGRAAGLAEAAS